MKKFFTLERIIFGVVIVVLLFFVFTGSNNTDSEFTRKEKKEMEAKIKTLKEEKAQLKEDNEKLDEQIAGHEEEEARLAVLQEENQTEIERLSNAQSKDVRVIDSFDSDELYSFFAGFDAQEGSGN